MTGLVPVYAAALFVTSALLFALEPLVAKGLLPTLGGGSAVWTTAVAFFQLALLCGYGYAHLAARLPGRVAAIVHVALLAAVALALPLAAPVGWVAPPTHQALWLFGRLAVTVGPIFVLLSATAPLVQRTFAATAHSAARDPYFLYAASNAGSLLALIAYPTIFEPLLGLGRQRGLWMWGVAVAVALLATGLLLARPAVRPPAAPAPSGGLDRPWRARGRWLVLSAVPSSLLLSVTTYMTTDVVALPLLWVLPLALYLATFVVAFSPKVRLPRALPRIQAFLLLPIAGEMFVRTDAAAWGLVPLHALAFFVTALVCHRALADARPPAERSTEYYLCIAAGGALGGMFNVFVAPTVFRTLLEYPLGLIAAALLRPAGIAGGQARARDVALPAAVAGGLLLAVPVIRAVGTHLGPVAGITALALSVSVAGALVYSFQQRSLRFGLGLAAIMAAGASYAEGATRVLHAARSFYGTHRVVLRPPATHTLAHGNTFHGAQIFDEHQREPLTYYTRGGPIGGVMAAFEGQPQRRRVGVVGLGAGALAAYAAAGERWTYYEIDPEVVAIARNRALFTYLGDARGEVDVVTGDARLTLAAVPDGTFGLLVLDAFSSDAVPAHLLTREAFALYLQKLAPGGVIAVHLSNRYLDLPSVVSGTASVLGLAALIRFDGATPEEIRAWRLASHWMVLARAAADLAPVAADRRWSFPDAGGPGWTDDRFDTWRILHITGR